MSQVTPHEANTGLEALLAAAAGQDPTSAVIHCWEQVSALIDDIDAHSADTPTVLPRWSVRDTVVHMSGTERMLGGEPLPDNLDQVPAEVRAAGGVHPMNEQHILASRDWSWEEVRADFARATEASAQRLRAADEEDLDALFPSPIGQIPYREFMRVRTFDCYIHILDICDALGWPMRLNGVDALVSGAFLLRPTGLPRTIAKRAGAKAGTRIGFVVPDAGGIAPEAGPGPLPGAWDAVVGDRVQLVEAGRQVDGAACEAAVRIEIEAAEMLRVLTGRVDGAQAAARFDGDTELGRRVLAGANTMV